MPGRLKCIVLGKKLAQVSKKKRERRQACDSARPGLGEDELGRELTGSR